MTSHVNRRVPRPATLCRLARNARTRSLEPLHCCGPAHRRMTQNVLATDLVVEHKEAEGRLRLRNAEFSHGIGFTRVLSKALACGRTRRTALDSASEVSAPEAARDQKNVVGSSGRSVRLDPEGEVHFINMAPQKQTHKPHQALSQLLANRPPYNAEELFRAVALGHVVAARVGSSIWKVEPLPNVDSTQIRPPCISTICLAMASPRPVPPLALVFELSTWWNWSKIRV
jgi:hypothetical protein